MTNDCLVKKLKGTVDNTNLKKLGYTRFYFHKNIASTRGNRVAVLYINGSVSTVNFYSTESVNVWNGSSLLYSGKNGNYNNVYGLIAYEFPDEEGYIDIFTNNNLTIITYVTVRDTVPTGATNLDKPVSYSITADELNYQPLEQIFIRVESFSGKFVPQQTLSIYALYNSGKVYSSVDFDLKDTPDIITYLWLGNNSNCHGDVSNLGNKTQMVELHLYNTECTGDLKSMLDSLHSNGKTSGKIVMHCVNYKITWNGEIFNNAKIEELTGNSSGQIDATFNTNGYTLS